MKGKYSDAFIVLKRIANSNKKVVPERYELLSLNDQNKQVTENTEMNEVENEKNEEQVILTVEMIVN
jgi:hypothetical protein